jgi:nucleoside-diphosphate-sugar epimerase
LDREWEHSPSCSRGRSGGSGKQALERFLDVPIALAGPGLQTFSVADLDSAPILAQKPSFLEWPEHLRDTGTPHAEIDRQFVDSAKLLEATGWEPRLNLEQGMRETVAWYRDHLDLMPIR